MSMLPSNYKNAETVKKEMGGGKDPRYIDPSSIPDGGSITVRPCGTFASGHLICGYEYFSETMKRTRRFPEFPENYLEDIGLTYEGRKNKTGEKDTPKYFMALVVLAKETNAFSILLIPQLKLRAQVERIYDIEDYQYGGDAIAPFYMTINRAGLKMDTVYTPTPVLKPASPEDIERWEKAKGGIWLPALFDGVDPFAGKPAAAKGAAAAKPKGQPPEATDALGAVAAPSANAPGTGDSW